jgi:hypothetical protein
MRQPGEAAWLRGTRTVLRMSGASPSGEGQVLREATRPIEIADLREVSNLRKPATEPRLWEENPCSAHSWCFREHVRVCE